MFGPKYPIKNAFGSTTKATFISCSCKILLFYYLRQLSGTSTVWALPVNLKKYGLVQAYFFYKPS